MTTLAQETEVETISELWGMQTSVLLRPEQAIDLSCNSVELSNDLAPPLRELRTRAHYLDDQRFAINDGLQTGNRELHSAARDFYHNEKNADHIDWLDVFRNVNGNVQESLTAAQAFDEQVSQARLSQSKDVIDWMSSLGIHADLTPSDIFVSPDLVIAYSDIASEYQQTRIDPIRDYYLRATAADSGLSDDGELIRSLGTFPIPVYGSKPEALTTLGSMLGHGTYVGAVISEYANHGVAMAIFTGSAGFVVWYVRPAVKVARQATTNWVAEKLGVTKVDKEE